MSQEQIDRLTAALMRAAAERLTEYKQSGLVAEWIGTGRLYDSEQSFIDGTIAVWMGEGEPAQVPGTAKRVRFLDAAGQWREGEIVRSFPDTRTHEIRYYTVLGDKTAMVDALRCQPK